MSLKRKLDNVVDLVSSEESSILYVYSFATRTQLQLNEVNDEAQGLCDDSFSGNTEGITDQIRDLGYDRDTISPHLYRSVEKVMFVAKEAFISAIRDVYETHQIDFDEDDFSSDDSLVDFDQSDSRQCIDHIISKIESQIDSYFINDGEGCWKREWVFPLTDNTTFNGVNVGTFLATVEVTISRRSVL